jgi:hypothetical protein
MAASSRCSRRHADREDAAVGARRLNRARRERAGIRTQTWVLDTHPTKAAGSTNTGHSRRRLVRGWKLLLSDKTGHVGCPCWGRWTESGIESGSITADDRDTGRRCGRAARVRCDGPLRSGLGQGRSDGPLILARSEFRKRGASEKKGRVAPATEGQTRFGPGPTGDCSVSEVQLCRASRSGWGAAGAVRGALRCADRMLEARPRLSQRLGRV